jgi:hypothetical protein
MEPDDKPRRPGTAKKIFLVAMVCVLAAAGGAFAAVAPGLASASLESEAGSAIRSAPGLASPVIAPVKLDVAPADGAKQVNPAAPVSVKVGNGRIESVTLTSTAGDPVQGTFADDGSSWTAAEPLKFNTEYSYTYVVTDGAGQDYFQRRPDRRVPLVQRHHGPVPAGGILGRQLHGHHGHAALRR